MDLPDMNRIDKLYTAHPFLGVRKLAHELGINRKRVHRLMKLMGIQAIYPKPNTSKPAPSHPVYPYLLKNLNIYTPNQVWGTDITYIKMSGSYFYLVAMLDWYSRYVISWELSDSMDEGFCSSALTQALNQAKPHIHNSDQGSQFTSNHYLGILKTHPDIHISMDHRGRCFDNIFTERLWRSVKYEEVYLKDYQNFKEAKYSLSQYFNFYNQERPHQSLGMATPAEIYFRNN